MQYSVNRIDNSCDCYEEKEGRRRKMKTKCEWKDRKGGSASNFDRKRSLTLVR